MLLTANLSARDRQPELMDQPALDATAHDRALAGLARLNRISRSAAAIWRPIKKSMRSEPSRRWRLLDVACGAGDVSLSVARRAAKAGYSLEMAGCDFSEQAIAHAQRRSRAMKIEAGFFHRDVLVDGLPEGYDFITSSLFLHHLDERDAVSLLREIGARANVLGVISDLRRTRLGYAMAVVAGRGLTRSRIVHVDGPLSVRGAFTTDEATTLAHHAGLEGRFQIRKIWPQRFLLTIKGLGQ